MYMMLSRIRPRFRQALVTALGVVSVYYFFFGVVPSPSIRLIKTANRETFGSLSRVILDTAVQDAYDKFSRQLVHLLKAHKPPVTSVIRTGSAGVVGYVDNIDSSLRRPDLVSIGTSEVNLMRQVHESFIEQATNVSLPYLPGTRGIVSTAGGSHLPVFIVSLRMLRRTGSNLPVELFLRSEEEHGDYLCNELLPSLNARCVIMDYLFDFKKSSFNLEKYQYKIFSVLFSTFEEVLLLDADNFPVVAPDYVFDSEPFRSSGLVTWPDFWISTAAAKFYRIQGTTPPPTNLRASTESGQVIANKRTHATALMIAAYYNFYGPSHFYPLLTQGGPGEGDKETFLAGAAAVGASFFQVSEPVSIIGYVHNEALEGVAMLQHDPVADHSGAMKVGPLFVHANFPKMDPNTLFGSEGPAIDALTGKHRRLWGEKSATMKTFGKDVERAMWDEIRHVACDLGGVFTQWKAIQPSSKETGTCEQVENHIEAVFFQE